MKILLINHNEIQKDPNLMKWIRTFQVGKFDYKAIGIQSDSPNEINDTFNIINVHLTMKNLDRRLGVIRKTLIFIQWALKIRAHINEFQPDVIQAANHLSLITTSFFLNSKTKFVYDANEFESEMYGMSPIRKRIVKFFEKKLWNRIDAVFFFSESIKLRYLELYGEKEILETIYGTPDVDKVFSSKESDYFREVYKIPYDSKIFVVTGYIADGRHLELILSAFGSSVKAHLVIVGFNLDREVLLEIDNMHNVHYHKFITQRDMVFYLNSADVGLCLIENSCLSYYLSAPQKFWEYLFAGLEVICSNFPEMERLTRDFDRGLTINNREDDLIKAINYYQDNHINRASIDLRRYKWETQAKKILDIYDILIGENL